MPKKKAKLTLHFAWNTCSVDPRQFNQQRQLVHPMVGESSEYLHSTRIAIEIPNTDEYIFSHVRATEDTPEIIILTPAGQFYAISLLEAPYTKAKETSVEDEWGEETTEDNKESEDTSEDDEWGNDESETSEDTTEESSEDGEEWDLESEEWD